MRYWAVKLTAAAASAHSPMAALRSQATERSSESSASIGRRARAFAWSAEGEGNGPFGIREGVGVVGLAGGGGAVAGKEEFPAVAEPDGGAVADGGRVGTGAVAVDAADLAACAGDSGGDQGLLDLSDGDWASGQVRYWHPSRGRTRRPAVGDGPGGAGAGDGPPGTAAAREGDGQPVRVVVVAPGGGGDAGHVRGAGDEQLLEFRWCHRRSAGQRHGAQLRGRRRRRCPGVRR